MLATNGFCRLKQEERLAEPSLSGLTVEPSAPHAFNAGSRRQGRPARPNGMGNTAITATTAISA